MNIQSLRDFASEHKRLVVALQLVVLVIFLGSVGWAVRGSFHAAAKPRFWWIVRSVWRLSRINNTTAWMQFWAALASARPGIPSGPTSASARAR